MKDEQKKAVFTCIEIFRDKRKKGIDTELEFKLECDLAKWMKLNGIYEEYQKQIETIEN